MAVYGSAEAGGSDPDRVRALLAARPIVLVGLMGSGKSAIGRVLAQRLGCPFNDSDHEVEAAAGMSVTDIFDCYGEPAFRDVERRVIARLLEQAGRVIATGGGAFMDEQTRSLILARGMTVWLKADLDVLVERTGRNDRRPLLRGTDRRAVLAQLMEIRHPVYAEAPIMVESSSRPKGETADAVLAALSRWDGHRDGHGNGAGHG